VQGCLTRAHVQNLAYVLLISAEPRAHTDTEEDCALGLWKDEQ
jgi:hypothetical protein